MWHAMFLKRKNCTKDAKHQQQYPFQFENLSKILVGVFDTAEIVVLDCWDFWISFDEDSWLVFAKDVA